MKTLSILGCIASCFFLQFSKAQNIDLFTVSQGICPKAKFKWVNGQEQEAIEYNTLVNIKVPIQLNKKIIWFNNLTYSINALQADFDNSVSTANYTLQGVILQTGLVVKLNEKSSIQALFAPRLLGEKLAFNSNTMQFGGLALYERVHSEKLTMRYGVLFNQDKFGPFFLPLIYTDWQFGVDYFMTGLWPIYGKIGKQINYDLQMGISEFALITTYPLNSQAQTTYMQRGSIDLSYFLRYRIKGNWHVEPRIGLCLSREYSQYANNDLLAAKISLVDIESTTPRTLLNGELASSAAFSIRLVYNYNKD